MTYFNNVIWVGCNSLGQANLATATYTKEDCRALIGSVVRREGDELLVPRRVSFLVGDEDAGPSGTRDEQSGQKAA